MDEKKLMLEEFYPIIDQSDSSEVTDSNFMDKKN